MITADEQALVADAVVVAVGGWAPRTLSGLVGAIPTLRVTQEQPTHFPAENALHWPSFYHHGGSALAADFDAYGLGSDDGVKVGFHGSGRLVDDPTGRDRSIDPTRPASRTGLRSAVVTRCRCHQPGVDDLPLHDHP